MNNLKVAHLKNQGSKPRIKTLLTKLLQFHCKFIMISCPTLYFLYNSNRIEAVSQWSWGNQDIPSSTPICKLQRIKKKPWPFTKILITWWSRGESAFIHDCSKYPVTCTELKLLRGMSRLASKSCYQDLIPPDTRLSMTGEIRQTVTLKLGLTPQVLPGLHFSINYSIGKNVVYFLRIWW